MSKKEKCTPFLKQCFVTAAVGINIIGHGCAMGYPGVLLPQISGPDSEIPLDHASASWIVSIVGVTQLIGGFVTPSIMGRIGRRAAHLAVTMPVLVGWFIITLATSFEALLIGRALHGLSVGMLSPLRSVLIGEYASPKNRGAFLTTVSLAQSFGIFFVHLVGSLLSWRQTTLVCVFFSFASLLMTIYAPESPSWLLSKGRYEECREVFRWLRGDDEEDELEEMIAARKHFEDARITLEKTQHMNRFESMISTIQKKEFYKPITIMVHAYVMIHFAGGTPMAVYSTTIIGMIMGPGVNAHFWMVFLDAQRLITNSIAVFVINKIRRRTMLIATGSLCIFSQLALAAYTYSRSYGYLQYDGIWIPALLVNLQFFTVASGMLPLPNVIGGEVFPLEYRSIGSSISLTAMSASFFLVLKTFMSLVDNVGIYGTYIVYTGCLTYCLVVILVLLPETKGKTLQQIEDEFRGRPLTFEELQSKVSLQACPIETYKRKISRQESIPLVH